MDRVSPSIPAAVPTSFSQIFLLTSAVKDLAVGAHVAPGNFDCKGATRTFELQRDINCKDEPSAKAAVDPLSLMFS